MAPPPARPAAPKPKTKVQRAAGAERVRRIAVCLDGSPCGERVLPHVRAIAEVLGASVTLLHVLERGLEGAPQPDPFGWELEREEAHRYLERLAQAHDDASRDVSTNVLEGRPAEQIRLWARRNDADLTVLCTHGRSGPSEWGLASTARKLVERAPGSLLLIPASSESATPVARYQRVLVALDGSPRAESVLPLAARLGAAQDAELILAHVVPVPELTEVGPIEAEGLELRERLVRRNERVAQEYLDGLRARLVGDGLRVRVVLLRGGDVRLRLARLIAEEQVDLVVISAHGRGSRTEMPYGSVAAFLLANATVPTWVVRPPAPRVARHADAHPNGTLRFPSQATP